MTIGHSIWRHKTKILGCLQAGLGAVVMYFPQLQQVLNPLHYGLILMSVGVATAVLGFLNTPSPPEEGPKC